jgi:hypothetical protein
MDYSLKLRAVSSRSISSIMFSNHIVISYQSICPSPIHTLDDGDYSDTTLDEQSEVHLATDLHPSIVGKQFSN